MNRHDEAELAALADGSLTPERRREVEARVAASPELAGLLAEQQRAVALAQNAAEQVQAPASLREGLARHRAPARRPLARRLAVFVPAAVAAVVVAAVLGVFGGSSSEQSFQVALASPSGGQSGSAKLTKTASGWRVDLKAGDLPRLENGRFYEAWLRNSAGVLVPVGTFNEGKEVTLWAGVSPKDFQTLTITRERADGDQASSGQKVLVGTIDTGSG